MLRKDKVDIVLGIAVMFLVWPRIYFASKFTSLIPAVIIGAYLILKSKKTPLKVLGLFVIVIAFYLVLFTLMLFEIVVTYPSAP
ncbi:hypothetical protein DRN44_09615 [Thermococci archaeon]|nr:MAG: hypothetical protein DRN44_09615 [Thermococci archaeon]